MSNLPVDPRGSRSPSLTGPIKPPAIFKSFDDAKAGRQSIYDSVLKAARNVQPIDNGIYKLALEDVDYLDDGEPDPEKVTAAKLKGRTLERRLGGTWRMYDQTGKVVSEKQQTIGAVPIQTDFGAYINRGNAMILRNQQRLRAGLYARKKQNDELEVFANFLPGQGLTHRYGLDPEKGVFYSQFRNSNIPMYSMLRAMGAGDEEIKDAWGEDLWKVNKARSRYDDDVRRLAAQVLPAKEIKGDFANVEKSLRERLTAMKLDPETTSRTLREPHENLTPRAALLATKRLIAIARGEDEPDSRDAMAFQEMVYPDKLFAERIAKDYAGEQRKMLFKATQKGNLDWLPNAPLRGQIYSALLNSGLGQMPEAPNPLEMLDRRYSVTRLGEGGISGGVDSIPEEGYDDETEVFTAKGWIGWPDVTSRTRFACRIDGRLVYRTATRLARNRYVGPMYGLKTRTLDYLVTPGHRLWVRKYRGNSSVNRVGLARWQFESAKDAHRTPREFQVTHSPFHGNLRTLDFSLPPVAGARKTYTFEIEDWAEFVGWYVSEGCLPSGTWTVTISQDAGANLEKTRQIDDLLTRMRIPHTYSGHNFTMSSKQLYRWLERHCGRLSRNLRLPSCSFTWPEAARAKLFESLRKGDGSWKKNGTSTYCSTNPDLVADVGRLAVTLGVAVGTRKPRKFEKEAHSDAYTCGFGISQVQGVTSERMYDDAYYMRQYAGDVHCAEVPGEVLFVRRRGSWGMWSGSSRTANSGQNAFLNSRRTPASSEAGIYPGL